MKIAGDHFKEDVPVELSLSKLEGTLNLGLVHLGYTANDPDGKSATLTLAVQVTGAAAQISKSPLSIQSVELEELNVLLEADKNEERRLQQTLNFPITYDTFGSIRPIQIKWTGVDGNKLYNWLTNSDGLRVQVTGTAVARIVLTASTKVDELCIAKWAQNYSSTETIKWYGTARTLALELINSNCIHMSYSWHADDETLTIQPLLVEQLGKRLVSAFSHQREVKVASISKAVNSEFFSLEDHVVVQFSTALSPGQLLIEHPEKVKDLSGDGLGLEALKR